MENLNKILKVNFIKILSVRGITILIGFILVPLTFKFLGETNYGLWATVFSFANWINLLDVGIGNGLRNELTKRFDSNDEIEKLKLISTGYIIMGIITLILLVIGLILYLSTDIGIILSVKTNPDLNNFVFISLLLMIVTLFLKLIHSIFYAIQKPYIINYLNLISSILTFLLLTFNKVFYINSNPLLFISIIYLGVPVIIYLIVNLVYLKKLNLFPSISLFDKTRIQKIMSLGMSFLIIQLAVIIVNTSDIFIVNTILGPNSTANFSILNKYTSVIIIGTSTFFTPLWNLYTSAINNKEYKWIKNIIRKQKNFTFVIVFISLILLLVSDYVFDIWISNSFDFEKSTLIIILTISIIHYWNNLHAIFLNGIGKLKLQTKTAVASILTNIPLSIILGLNYGINGILVATIISISIFGVLGPIAVKKELKKLNVK